MRILNILASGIGNSILFGPTLRTLRTERPDAKIDLYAYQKPFAEPFRGSRLIDDIVYHEGIETILHLRGKAYDASITAFPSNRWQFNLFARLVGASRRVTHSYDSGGLTTFSFLQNEKVPADPSLHDVRQNLNLLKPFNISSPDQPELFFHLEEEHRDWAREFLSDHHLSNLHRIGIHPGAGPLEWKRAPLKKFIQEIEEKKKSNSCVLIFGGPDEASLKQNVRDKLDHQFSFTSVTANCKLKETAALVETCDVFISNDTALSHIATAMEVPTQVVFFNGTNPTRTRPWRDDAEVIYLKENQMDYPYK